MLLFLKFGEGFVKNLIFLILRDDHNAVAVADDDVTGLYKDASRQHGDIDFREALFNRSGGIERPDENGQAQLSDVLGVAGASVDDDVPPTLSINTRSLPVTM